MRAGREGCGQAGERWRFFCNMPCYTEIVRLYECFFVKWGLRREGGDELFF